MAPLLCFASRKTYVQTDCVPLLTTLFDQSQCKKYRVVEIYVTADTSPPLKFTSSLENAMPKPPGRPRVTGGGRKSSKYSRSSFSNAQKLDVVRYLALHDIRATLLHYFPFCALTQKEAKRKFIYQWRKQEGVLEDRWRNPATAALKYVRDLRCSTVLPHELEMDVVVWINLLRKDGVPVSASMLQLKAQEVAETNDRTLEASWHWRRGFLFRHHLSIRARTRQGQITPSSAKAKAIEFGIAVRQKMVDLRVNVVYNADQTGNSVHWLEF
jgi:hypothetical protein